MRPSSSCTSQPAFVFSPLLSHVVEVDRPRLHGAPDLEHRCDELFSPFLRIAPASSHLSHQQHDCFPDLEATNSNVCFACPQELVTNRTLRPSFQAPRATYIQRALRWDTPRSKSYHQSAPSPAPLTGSERLQSRLGWPGMQLSESEPTSPIHTRIPTVARSQLQSNAAFSNSRFCITYKMPERASLNTTLSGPMSAAHMLPNGTKPDPEGLHSGSVSPRTVPAPSLPTPNPPGKRVEFVLSAPYRARLPLRVSIFLHDTTDSIVSTVKNFFGLYPAPGVSKGISFEDDEGNTLIARYENFRDNMTVHVRVIESPLESDYPGSGPPHGYYGSHALAPYGLEAHVSRPSSRASRLRSPSPNSRGRRSTSTSANPAAKKGRSRSSKTRDGLNDSFTGSTNGDSASGRAKEQLGTTDISVENIVEGGRRKRAKFESTVSSRLLGVGACV
jgi:hypothetical protein